jgi:hypothetical protein
MWMDNFEWKVNIFATKNERGETSRSSQIASPVRWVELNPRIFFQENAFAFKEE